MDLYAKLKKGFVLNLLEVYYPTGRDVRGWESAHRNGDVPDLWPYGLHNLATEGMTITSVEALPLRPWALVAPFLRLDRRSMASLSWDRTSIAWDEDLALRLFTERPTARKFSGVIWASDRVLNKTMSAKDMLLKRLLLRFDGLWALSEPQTEHIRQWLGNAAPPVHFLTFGIDHNFFTPWPYPKRPLVLSLGRDRDRDPKTLFEVADEVLQRRPDVEIVVQSSTSLTPPPGVQIISTVSHSRLREYYRRASVVTVATRPNIHVSGMTVALESMATARPVVMSDTPGMRGYVEDGVTGLLYPSGDAAGMARGILGLLESPQAAAEMGRRGRERVESKHTTEIMAQKLKEIING